jgi:ABC-2 type transport system ATP-binding protein
LSATDAIVCRGLSKTYTLPVASPLSGGVFRMPFPDWPLWLRAVLWPARFPLMLTRGVLQAAIAPFLEPFTPGREVKALDNLDLTIRRGEVFGLLGPNGAGKTTTINLLLGLIWPTRGRCTVMGYAPDDMRAKRRIGFLPEETYLYRHLNAEETLRFYGKLFGLDSGVLSRRIEDLLDLVGFDKTARRRPLKTYSKGMARRIGLAQALINDPDVVILDEPTSGLDPIGSLQMKDIILRLKKEGKTILMSSHLLADVEDCCDRAAILYRGKVARQGTIAELLSVKDTFQLQARDIGPELQAKIEALIAAEGGKVESVGYQRTRLESLFRDIVMARREEETRAAAAPGRRS